MVNQVQGKRIAIVRFKTMDHVQNNLLGLFHPIDFIPTGTRLIPRKKFTHNEVTSRKGLSLFNCFDSHYSLLLEVH